MPVIHFLTIAASCAGLALTGIALMAAAVSTGLALALVALFLFTAFYGFSNLITDHTGA